MELLKRFLLILGLVVFAAACTDLEEELASDLTGEEATEFLNSNTDVSSLLQAAYDGLRLPYQDQSRFWAAAEHTTDAGIDQQ